MGAVLTRLASAALVALVLPALAAAEHACRFDTECVDTEPCAPSGFEATLSGEAGTMAMRLASEAGTVPGTLSVTPGGATFFLGLAERAVHLLTLAGDGGARYSVHLPDVPMAVTYVGTCEAVP